MKILPKFVMGITKWHESGRSGHCHLAREKVYIALCKRFGVKQVLRHIVTIKKILNKTEVIILAEKIILKTKIKDVENKGESNA